MKKALLFVILALSLNVFAQSKRSFVNRQSPRINSLENAKGSMEAGGRISFTIDPEKNFEEAINSQTQKQGSLIHLIDSVYSWTLDTLNSDWSISDKFTNYNYDANYNLTRFTRQAWNGYAWGNIQNYLYTFDANNYKTNYTIQEWLGGAWVNSDQYIYSYNEGNKTSVILSQIWHEGAWENFQKIIYDYDSSYNMTRMTTFDWPFGAWRNILLSIYTYDAANNRTTMLSQVWQNNSWLILSKSIYTYDANNNRILELVQEWNNGSFTSIYQVIYTFDTDNFLIRSVKQAGHDTVWSNSTKYEYTYDGNHNRTVVSHMAWLNNAWVGSWSRISNFDENSFLNSEVGWRFNYAGTEVTSADSSHYYYHTIVNGINDLPAQDQSLTISPNPSSGKFTLTSTSPISSIEVYNLIGELIYSDFNLNRLTSKEINLTAAPKGIYFVKIKNGEKMQSREIVIK
jgi:hypothetical protein